MKSRASRIAAALILLTCVACPVIDSFDTWDNALETGNETEYTLVFVALCIGASYSLARLFSDPCVLSCVSTRAFQFRRKRPAFFCGHAFVSLFLNGPSPPLLSLRI